MAELDQINVSTLKYIRKNPALVDNTFQHDPLLAYLKLNVREDWEGGAQIQENFIYRGMVGGAYRKGKEFNITERQIEQGMTFTPRLYQVNVTLAKEDVQVFNTGPLAAFRLVDSRMTGAYLTMGANLAISLYLNGTRAGYEGMINGLAEALNDNSANSWDSSTYSTYGTITRGGEVGTKLNSVPENVNGAIEYNQLEESYADATFGNVEPNLGVTTVLGYSYIKEKFQTQQRFNDTQDPSIGFNGLKFNSATLIKSRYAPGSDISGTSFDEAVDFLKESSDGVVTAYPTLTAETLFWINARKPYLNMYISTDPEFGFGFTGFKPAQGNTKIAGQLLAALNITMHPRYHKQLYGITG